MSNERSVVLISHANPEDNEFTLWLAARLSGFGYKVWTDLTNLIGGEYFWDNIEHVIRNEALKVFVVISKSSVAKEGVKDEVQLSLEVGKLIKDRDFLVPIKIDETSFSSLNINVIRKNTIDASCEWNNALMAAHKILVKANCPTLVRSQVSSFNKWYSDYCESASRFRKKEEGLITNWLNIISIPESICVYKLQFSKTPLSDKLRGFKLPWVEYKNRVVTFASEIELRERIGHWVIIEESQKFSTDDFFSGKVSVASGENGLVLSRILNNLLRQGVELHLDNQKLNKYYMSNGKIAWYYNHNQLEKNVVKLNINGSNIRRNIVGISQAKGVYWHYAVEPKIVVGLLNRIALVHHVVFTEDGYRQLDDEEKMHKIRRSFCRMWFNEKWRDLMMAYIATLVNDNKKIEVQMSGDSSLIIDGNPITVISPVSVDEEDGKADVEQDEYYLDDGEEEDDEDYLDEQ